MTWNYRVIETKSEGETSWAIHEVYYYPDGSFMGCTENPVSVDWVEGDDPRAILDMMRLALEKPVLTDADFVSSPK
jgi:hypothetical protein